MSFTIRTRTITCDHCGRGCDSAFRSVLDAWARTHTCPRRRGGDS